MSFDLEQLYSLLPAIYRIKDIERGDQPLKALLSVVADTIQVLEEDLAQLYDDQFIETCQEWAIPYIGDLVSYQTAHDVLPQSLRVEVANTISYRRRKGTAAMLEQLARDVTGWNVHVVEFFKLLALSQHMNRVRLDATGVDLRNEESIEQLGTPFSRLARTAEVGSVAAARGRYNIPNVGIFIWRLNAYSLTEATPFKVDNYRYLFNPLGGAVQLFSRPQLEQDLTQLSGRQSLAMPITLAMLARYLDTYYGAGKSILLTVNGEALGVDKVEAADLSDTVRQDSDGNSIWANLPREKIAIDPVRGRIAFPRGQGRHIPKQVQVSYCYGFSAAMGGGEYSRLPSFTRIDPQTTQVLPIQNVSSKDRSITAALGSLNGSGVVEISDSGSYAESPSIDAPANACIELRAADGHRPLLVLTNDATKTGNPVTPELAISGEEGAWVVLNGLVISEGRLHVSGNLSRLTLRHCTLVPGLLVPDRRPAQDDTRAEVVESESESEKVTRNARGEKVVTEREQIEEEIEIDRYPPSVSIIVEAPSVLVELDQCIVGGLRVDPGVQVHITDSIVDATSQHAVAYGGLDDAAAGGALQIENSTIIGQVHTAQMELASNSIFLARHSSQEREPVHVVQRQHGCARYSYLPARSRTPRLYHCHLGDDQAAEWVHPQFNTLRYGKAAYCQLSRMTDDAIRRGADDESEMGAFHDLYQPQRETNLALRLKEYLRFTLEAGVFYQS